MRKHLLIVRAGDASLHPRWLKGGQRNFDLMVSYYGSTPGKFNDGIEYYHEMKGPRWPAHHAICSHHMPLLSRYRRIGFACDDLDAATGTWNRLFDTCEWYELDLAQPAVEGNLGQEITRAQDGSLMRYTSYVECMCPVFSPRALEMLRATFSESVSGWGLDYVWASRLPYPEFKMAIIDCIPVLHTSPIRQGTLRPVLDTLGIDPVVEMRRVMARHGIQEMRRVEHARLPIPHGLDGGITWISAAAAPPGKP